MSLDWIGLSAFVIIDRNSQKKKLYATSWVHVWKPIVILKPYNPSLWGINIVAKHEIRCEVPAPILPHRRMTRGAKRARYGVSFFLPKREYVRFPWTRFSLPSARHFSQYALARAAIK